MRRNSGLCGDCLRFAASRKSRLTKLSCLITAPRRYRLVNLSAPRSKDPSSSATPLDYIILAVAIVGAITGVAALMWQALTFYLEGARIRVILKVAWVGQAGAVMGPPGMWDWGRPPAPGYELECLAVEVRNKGRSPTSVTSRDHPIPPIRGAPP